VTKSQQREHLRRAGSVRSDAKKKHAGRRVMSWSMTTLAEKLIESPHMIADPRIRPSLRHLHSVLDRLLGTTDHHDAMHPGVEVAFSGVSTMKRRK
jgi:hypothetical protein